MLIYKIIFLFHITIKKLFKYDLRPILIRSIYSTGVKNFFQTKKFNSEEFEKKIDDAYKIFEKNKDKRLLWDCHRLDFLNNNEMSFEKKINALLFWIDSGPVFQKIIFENMMECSLRASNILFFIKNNEDKIDQRNKKILLRYLKKTYILNFICPDMYIKRNKIFISEQSNNHFIFCMCYQIIYLDFVKGLKNSYLKTKIKYFEKKFSNDGFLMEGSTFYSYSVSNAILKVLFIVNKHDYLPKYKRLAQAVDSLNCPELDLKNLNFGDKDDSILLPSLDEDYAFIRFQKITFSNKKNFLSDNIHLFRYEDIKIILNGRNIYNYGTNGHYHDDYGHFNLYTNKKIILDPGTKSYTEPGARYDGAEYHNAPFAKNSNSMTSNKSFEKKFNSEISKSISANHILITRNDSSGEWSRKIHYSTPFIEDSFKFNDESYIKIYFVDKPTFIEEKERLKTFKVNNLLISLSCSQLFNYNVRKTMFSPHYSELKNAYILEMFFNKNLYHKLKWDFVCEN